MSSLPSNSGSGHLIGRSDDVDLEQQRSRIVKSNNQLSATQQLGHNFEFVTAIPDDHRLVSNNDSNAASRNAIITTGSHISHMNSSGSIKNELHDSGTAAAGGGMLPSISKYSLEMATFPRAEHHNHLDNAILQHHPAENRRQSSVASGSSSQPTTALGSAALRRRFSEASADQVSPGALRFMRFPETRRREVLVPMGLTLMEVSQNTMESLNSPANERQQPTASPPALRTDLSHGCDESRKNIYDSIQSDLGVKNNDRGQNDTNNENGAAGDRRAGIRIQSEPQLLSNEGPVSITLQPAPPSNNSQPTSGQQSPVSQLRSSRKAASLLALNESAHMKASFSTNLMVKTEKNECINYAKLEEYLDKFQQNQSPTSAGANGVTDTAGGNPIASFGLGLNSKISFYSINTGRLEAGSLQELNVGDNSLSDLLINPNFWIDVYWPSETDVKVMAEIFNIHPLTIEDILTSNTREKCEMSKNYYSICYRSFDQDPGSSTYMQAFNVYILVYPTFVLTFHHFPLVSVGNVVKRLEQLKSYLVITPHWINYALLDDITDQFLPVLHALEMEIDAIDDLVLVISAKEQSDMLRRITQARKRVTNLKRLLQNKSDVVRVNIKRLESLIDPRSATQDQQFNAMIRDICLYLGDIQDHVITMNQLLEHIDTTLSRSHSNYLAQISIDITLTSNRTNDTMKKLTALASMMVPLNLITGLMGMNIRVPGMIGFGDDDPTYSWFTGIIVLMVVICMVGYAAIRRMQGFDETPQANMIDSSSSLSPLINSRTLGRGVNRKSASAAPPHSATDHKRRTSKRHL